MNRLIANLLERRVPQYLVLYVGVAWGLIQFTQLIVDVFLFSPHWTKVAIVAAFMLWPAYVFVVYRHARPGTGRWNAADKLSVPANVLVAGIALFFMFRGEDLGAVTTSVTVADETGALVEREMPKQKFRKRIALFELDTDGLAEDERWRAGVVGDAVLIEMLADDFLDPVGPEQVAERLRRAGYADQRNVPLALKREVAEDVHADWILSGTIGAAGDSYTAAISLHAAGDGKLAAETTYVSGDLLALVDGINSDLRKQLAVPDRDGVPDLPARDYFTDSQSALEAYGKARNLMTLQNDWAGAVALLEQAVADDATFTLAQHALAGLFASGNRNADAVAPIQAALRNAYRLPERAQFLIKADYYAINQQFEKRWAVIEMWSELYPDDVLALENLHRVQLARNQRAEAIATLEKIYALNAGKADVLKEIARLHTSLGNFDAARAALRRYVDRFPDDYTGIATLASIELDIGDLDAGRRLLDRALLLEPANTELLVRSSNLHVRVGEFAAAEKGFRAALSAAASPAARASVLAALQQLYEFEGQTTAALDALHRRIEEAKAFMLPVELVSLRVRNVRAYLQAGREAEVREILDEYGLQLEGPSNISAVIAELELALDERDVAAAESLLADLDAMIEANQQVNFRDDARSARARLAGLNGDWKRACELRQESLRSSPTAVLLYAALAECLRELGRLDEAERAVKRLLEFVPGNAPAYVELARILAARGNTAGARAALERALSLWARADADFELAAEARRLLAAL